MKNWGMHTMPTERINLKYYAFLFSYSMHLVVFGKYLLHSSHCYIHVYRRHHLNDFVLTC